MNIEEIENLVKTIVSSFVTKPEAVEVYTREADDKDGDMFVIGVKVDKEDIGSCIGKSGGHAEALRTVIGLIGFKNLEKKVFVNIEVPEKTPHFAYKK